MNSNVLRRMAVGISVYCAIIGLIVGVLMLMRPPPPKNPAVARRLVQAIGMTPLMSATFPPETPQLVAIVQILLQFHADPSVKDKSGMTVLAHAQKNQRPGIVKLLQQTSGQTIPPAP